MADRDKNGKFIKGHQVSTGNKGGRPPRAREEQYNKIMMTACTFEDWEAIVATAVQQAKQGDQRAREWLCDYLVGKAPQTVALHHSMADETRQFMRELVGLSGDDEEEAEANG